MMNLSVKSTPEPNVFLDANILLEIILGRSHEIKARSIVEKYAGHSAISTLTAHLVIHFGQTIVSLPILRQFLQDYLIVSLEAADFEWAFTNARTPDFEDALQLGVCVRHGCDRFLTFDRTLVKAYASLPTVSVEQS